MANDEQGSSQLPLAQRVRAAWLPGIGYHELMAAAFPPDRYPRAFARSGNGGPPGCAMAFGAALRRLGLRRDRRGSGLIGRPAPPPAALP